MQEPNTKAWEEAVRESARLRVLRIQAKKAEERKAELINWVEEHLGYWAPFGKVGEWKSCGDTDCIHCWFMEDNADGDITG